MELACERADVLVTSADTYRSFALNDFVRRFPDRYFEFGIAEQNMLAAAGAMAGEGYAVFSVGYSPFLSMRALEQIRTFIAYPNQNVKIVAGLGGLSGDTDGVTHQGTEDIGILRTIPNMTVLCPADAVAARAFVGMAARLSTPVYLRLGRGATPVVYPGDQRFELGKAIRARDDGTDFAILTVGPCVGEAMQAADRLREMGMRGRVLDMHTIKPLDEAAVAEACDECRNLLTVEDGCLCGGFGGAVAETLADQGLSPRRFKRLGLTTFGTAGTLPELLRHFGLDAASQQAAVLSLLA